MRCRERERWKNPDIRREGEAGREMGIDIEIETERAKNEGDR